MLAIQFQFLYPHYFAKDVRDPGQVEWPPHPDRVFGALIQAAYASHNPEPHRALLRWLGSQPPPSIHAPDARAWTSHIKYVPIAVNANPAMDFYNKAPKAENSITLEALELSYLWPEACPTEEQAARFRELLSYVGYLGSPKNMARARLLTEVPAPNYLPANTGELVMRVPHAERLESREREHYQRMELGRINYLDPDIVWAHYRRKTAWSNVSTPVNRFHRVALFRLVGRGKLADTWNFAEAIRNRLIACTEDQLGWVPELIHGHAESGSGHVPHVALSPRANVHHQQADGGLHGIALLAPVTPSYDQDRALLDQVLGHPDLQEFQLGSMHFFLQLHETRNPQAALEDRYRAASKNWCTVSPVMLDRFPKGISPEPVLRLMLEREGIAWQGGQLKFASSAFVTGVPPAHRFQLRNGPSYRRPLLHLRLELPQAMAGPFTLGTARYFGLGHFIAT
jgi:CRISPR-associated protein Csb2